jgi:ABC-type dipeptide/oligopeptide/nickel transport system permease subunit
MAKLVTEKARTPFYYSRNRFLKNFPAVIGLIFILLSILIALLGYLIMPDSTPNANDGAIQIQKQLPGFKVMVLKSRKSIEVEHVNFFQKIFTGEESEYTIIPINKFEVKNLTVEFVPYGGREYKETLDLLPLVHPIFIGKSALITKDSSTNYKIDGDKITYLDSKEKICYTTTKQLVKDFEKNNIETRRYLLGTDKSGRDILSKLLFGARISLAIGFISVLISLTVGITLGSLAGFFGGLVDNIISWIMTVVWSIPSIMLVIAISLALGKGLWVAFVAVGLTTWVDVARVVRGQILTIKEKTYVEAARALGMSDFRIIFKHILPNLYSAIIVIATSNFASAILVEAGLSFLGLGVQPPMPSWGMMIHEGYKSMGLKNEWHLILFPSIAISVLVLSFNLLGNGLRDANDPTNSKN